jgi:hypothetical protein
LFDLSPSLASARKTEGENFPASTENLRWDKDDLSAFPAAKSAREINDDDNQQNQSQPAAAENGATKVKPAAAEQEQQNDHEQ